MENTNTVKGKRIPYIDSVKGLAILLVVLGHIFLLGESSLISQVNKYIYSFHIPLFFLISGMLYCNKNIKFVVFLKSKLKRLLIPYLSFSLMLYPIWVLIEKYIKGTGEHIQPKYFWGIFLGNADLMPWGGPLWFLISLFVVSCAFYFIGKMNRINILLTLFFISFIGFISTFLAFSLPWMLDTSLTALVIYGIGYLLKDSLLSREQITKYDNKGPKLIVALGLLLMGYITAMKNSNVNMVNNQYGNYVFFYISALATSIGVILLFKVSYTNQKNSILNKWLIYFGENSIVVLALHGRTMTVTGLVLGVLGINVYSSIVYSFLYAIFILILQVPFIHIINRYFPFILGLNQLKLKNTNAP